MGGEEKKKKNGMLVPSCLGILFLNRIKSTGGISLTQITHFAMSGIHMQHQNWDRRPRGLNVAMNPLQVSAGRLVTLLSNPPPCADGGGSLIGVFYVKMGILLFLLAHYIEWNLSN